MDFAEKEAVPEAKGLKRATTVIPNIISKWCRATPEKCFMVYQGDTGEVCHSLRLSLSPPPSGIVCISVTAAQEGKKGL